MAQSYGQLTGFSKRAILNKQHNMYNPPAHICRIWSVAFRAEENIQDPPNLLPKGERFTSPYPLRDPRVSEGTQPNGIVAFEKVTIS